MIKALVFLFVLLLPCLSYSGSAKPMTQEEFDAHRKKSSERLGRSMLQLMGQIGPDGRPVPHAKIEKNHYTQTKPEPFKPGKGYPVRDIVKDRKSSYPLSKPIGSH